MNEELDINHLSKPVILLIVTVVYVAKLQSSP